MAEAMQLLGELNAYAELIPDVDLQLIEAKILEKPGLYVSTFFRNIRMPTTIHFVNVNWIAKKLNINYPTANRLLKSLTELGILKEITGYSRNRFFVLEKYLNLFRS